MNKAISVLAAIMIVFSFIGCSRQTSNENASASSSSLSQAQTNTSAESTGEPKESGKILIAYFTWSGNTKQMAEYISEQTGGDIFEIKPTVAYPDDYNKTGEIAKKERDDNARPEISNLPKSVEQYDKILIGYPIWWHTAPMIIASFLESYDLSGKEIYPFSQSSSMDEKQFQNSVELIKKSAKGAKVNDGLFVNSSDEASISLYLNDNNLNK